jgi:N-acetylglucosaminyldiphosphoundecaprenol N-acetyl-beta-D-mannosaminyltransferase
MINKGKQNVVGVLVNALDYDAAVSQIIATAKARRPMAVSALAVHGLMTGVLDETHRYRLNHLDLIVPDGQPVRWALNWLHRVSLTDRVYGPNLMLKLCERAAAENLSVYLYGSRLEVLQPLSRNLVARFPGLTIAGMQPSRFKQITREEKQLVSDSLLASGASLVFVGLGCPRQEVWVYEYRDTLPMPVIAIGAAFDFHAGVLAQAPIRLQKAGLEWLFRLLHEPSRLWRRYLFLNPYYLLLVFLQKAGLKKFDPQGATPPVREIGYG